MTAVEIVGGVLLVLGGLVCLRGHRRLDDWSFRIWTVPSDYDAPAWFRSGSSYIVAAILCALGAGLIVAAFT